MNATDIRNKALATLKRWVIPQIAHQDVTSLVNGLADDYVLSHRWSLTHRNPAHVIYAIGHGIGLFSPEAKN